MVSADLGERLTQQVRALLWDAFDDFSEDDWQHGVGGTHIVAIDGRDVVGHASVVLRPVYLGERTQGAGYVEGVAVAADRRGQGIGTAVMRTAEQVIKDTYPFAVLSTSEHLFYERLGWRRWQGPTFVVEGGFHRRTPEEDAGVMVLSGDWVIAEIDLSLPLAVDARPGDDW